MNDTEYKPIVDGHYEYHLSHDGRRAYKVAAVGMYEPDEWLWVPMLNEEINRNEDGKVVGVKDTIFVPASSDGLFYDYYDAEFFARYFDTKEHAVLDLHRFDKYTRHHTPGYDETEYDVPEPEPSSKFDQLRRQHEKAAALSVEEPTF